MKVSELIESIKQFEDYEVVVDLGQKVEDKTYILRFGVDLNSSYANQTNSELHMGLVFKDTVEVVTEDNSADEEFVEGLA